MTERTESWRRFIPYLAAFLCGLIACLGLPFWNIWPATLIGFAFFYTLIAPITNAKSGFILGFFFGLGYFLLGLYWIGNALFINWDDYWWAYPFALLGLPLFLSCFWGTAMAIATHFSASNSLHRFILTVLCLSFVEWVRGWAFTGFPWNLTGYIWNAQLEIAQISHVIGIYLLSLITIFWGLGLGFTGLLIKQKHKIKASALGLFLLFSFIATFVYGQQRLDQSAEPLAQNQHKTLIVQPNIPQALKWQSDLMLDHIGNLLSLSRYDAQKHGDVSNTKQLFIVWPETAMSDIYFEHKAIKDALTSALQSWPVEDVTLFTGMLHSNEENAGYYNSLYQINAQGELINRYDKSHLVPFGEYIPYLPPNIIEPLVGIVGFSAGEEERNLIAGDIALIPLICYEIIFPHIGRRLYNLSDKSNTITLTVTNDAWYGDAAGPYQHHAIARFRAIEFGTPVLRSANTGISGAFDAYGRDLGRIDYGVRNTILIDTPKSLNKKTSYTHRGNLLFFTTLSIFAFLFIVLKKVEH